MKKVVGGLVGVVIGCASFIGGCQTSSYDKQINEIRSHYYAIKQIIGAEPEESYHIFDGKNDKKNFKIKIVGGAGTRILGNNDLNSNEEYDEILRHTNTIKKIIGADPNDSYYIFDAKEKGDPFRIYISGEENIKSIIFIDSDTDGSYDKKNTLIVPRELDIQIFPPRPKSLYKPKPSKKDKRGILI